MQPSRVIASLLKAGTGGLSTAITASAQGAVAYYTTTVVGRAAEAYLAEIKGSDTIICYSQD